MVVNAAVNAPSTRPVVGPEQLRYARVLEIGVRIGFVLLVVAFFAYVAGILPAHVALERLPDLWTLPAHEYAVEAAVPRGWGWVRLLLRGEMLAQGAIAVLAGVSIVCFAALVPLYRARGDRLYLTLAIVEILILGLAASGVLTMHH